MSVDLLSIPQWSLKQEQKEDILFEQLFALTSKHNEMCAPYSRILNSMWSNWRDAKCIEDLPFLPVQLFKTHTLSSVDEYAKKITMTSSGTTGSTLSKIIVDNETSALQTKSLSRVVTSILGQKRPPMLVLDTREVIRDPRLLTARGAGVLGMMRYGRDHEFALNSDLSINIDAIRNFLNKHNGERIFMFGFTYMVWLYLYEALRDGEADLKNAVLIHSGGWKKLQDRAVDNNEFRKRLFDRTGIKSIYNFYGMVEQMGSIFLEGDETNALYAPNVTDVVIRDPLTLKPLPIGEEGLIQVLSIIPNSYPGHSLLTEDMGRIISIDSGVGGRFGKAITVSGRLPRAELRGCSDVHADNLRKAVDKHTATGVNMEGAL